MLLFYNFLLSRGKPRAALFARGFYILSAINKWLILLCYNNKIYKRPIANAIIVGMIILYKTYPARVVEMCKSLPTFGGNWIPSVIKSGYSDYYKSCSFKPI